MLNLIGFSAQFIALVSITAILISCISSLQSADAVISADRIPCAEVATAPSIPHPIVKADDEYYVIDDSNDDATQLTVSCALSMVSPIYTVTIDEPARPADHLSALTIRQLKALCRERGIKRYSSLRKHELIALLQH